MEPDRTDEPSAAAHGTARHYSPNTDQVIAELCEAADNALKFVSQPAAYDRLAQALSKARGAAG